MAAWSPTGNIDLATDAQKKADTRTAMNACRPILKDMVAMSGPLLSAALLDE